MRSTSSLERRAALLKTTVLLRTLQRGARTRVRTTAPRERGESKAQQAPLTHRAPPAHHQDMLRLKTLEKRRVRGAHRPILDNGGSTSALKQARSHLQGSAGRAGRGRARRSSGEARGFWGARRALQHQRDAGV